MKYFDRTTEKALQAWAVFKFLLLASLTLALPCSLAAATLEKNALLA